MNLTASKSTSDEHEKDDLKEKLLFLGYYKTPDKRQLYELSLTELKRIYQNEIRKKAAVTNEY
ncbi:Fur-regulated basic protein FbpA [Bacillus sp. 03113]|uniref:Fur-regulated basic protein FbpA n=1 Tax=Bacillus sp. 03113 TaxID=2578211 RepID=UPI00114249B5|nr:Fur-regulated basic protein FbpA [Bacillus sp. 03113]